MQAVVAIGGNALLRRDQPFDMELQRQNVAVAAEAIAELAGRHQVVVTHGNGPQVGLLALQAEAHRPSGAVPLDILGAESEGMIGYLIEQELGNRLPGRDVATLLTQVEVAADDPAFQAPSKPIGPVYTAAEAWKLERQRGWSMAPDGTGYRRVVPSPLPRRIMEMKTIRLLAAAGVIVVCSGGGGIPVVVTEAGSLAGVEAVIDKDRSASLLACELGADALLMLTDVEAIWADWGEPGARRIRRATPEQLMPFGFAAGSMGPKVAAASEFVAKAGGIAGIGALGDAASVLEGRCGTIVHGGSEPMAFWEDDLLPEVSG